MMPLLLSGATMVGERELVALLYRADWTRLCLSADVRGAGEPAFSMISHAMRGGPRGAEETGAQQQLRLLLAPGRRYREESPDGRLVRGCDGERGWVWVPDPPADAEIRLSGGPEPPFPALLAPSWLLSGYQLTIEGETTACGRAGVLVAAAPRRHARRGARRVRGLDGLPPAWLPPLPRAPHFHYDHVSAVVDADLGILLSCELRLPDRAPELTEFVRLRIDPQTDPAVFTAPPGSFPGDEPKGAVPFGGPLGAGPSGGPLGGIGRDAARTTAGLAAGGLGAAIRYMPFGRPDPFARATSEDDPEAEMPRDEQFPGDVAAGGSPSSGTPVGDEVLHLLYRGGAAAPELTGTLHRWFDLTALLEAVPEPTRRTGLGGVGFLVDAVRDAAREAGPPAHHEVRTVRMGGWDKYRIDLVYPRPPGREESSGGTAPGGRGRRDRGRHQPLTVACDGRQRWAVFADRVVVGPPGSLRGDLASLLDGSWLLGCDLSGGEEITVGGRRAYRVAATLGQPPVLFASLFKLAFPAVAAVDAESGRLLRLTTYQGGKPVARHELRDVSPGGGGDFGFQAPAGLRVVTESPEQDTAGENPIASMAKAAADAVKKRADEKARTFLGTLRGSPKPGTGHRRHSG